MPWASTATARAPGAGICRERFPPPVDTWRRPCARNAATWPRASTASAPSPWSTGRRIRAASREGAQGASPVPMQGSRSTRPSAPTVSRERFARNTRFLTVGPGASVGRCTVRSVRTQLRVVTSPMCTSPRSVATARSWPSGSSASACTAAVPGTGGRPSPIGSPRRDQTLGTRSPPTDAMRCPRGLHVTALTGPGDGAGVQRTTAPRKSSSQTAPALPPTAMSSSSGLEAIANGAGARQGAVGAGQLSSAPTAGRWPRSRTLAARDWARAAARVCWASTEGSCDQRRNRALLPFASTARSSASSGRSSMARCASKIRLSTAFFSATNHTPTMASTSPRAAAAAMPMSRLRALRAARSARSCTTGPTRVSWESS